MRISDWSSDVCSSDLTLYLKTHSFHWNVTGQMFQTLHTMFEQQYTELWTALDEVAERIRSLGEPAPGSYKTFAKITSIQEEEAVPAAKNMVRQLGAGHEEVEKTPREIFHATNTGKG